MTTPNEARIPITDVTVTVQRWPVLARTTDDDGKIRRGQDSYVRTKEPQATREVRVIAFLSRTRIEVAFNEVTSQVFSVNTGRGISMPDWVIEKQSLRAIRKKKRELFPKDVAEDAAAEDSSTEGDPSHVREG